MTISMLRRKRLGSILALLILLHFTGEDELDEERDLIIQAIEKL
jgi:hypothetical protein